jgi:hypothetical protein
MPESFVAQLPGRQPLLEANLCEQLQRPGAARLAEEPRAVMEEFAQLVVALLRPDRLDSFGS